MSHPIFEESTSPLTTSNDGRMHVYRERQTQPNGWAVIDHHDSPDQKAHVEAFTLKREVADAFIAGYDYHERLARTGVEHRANLAKLEQLVQDADKKRLDATSTSYWAGMRDGLRRAITVLEGRG
jgi:hypothetical protein